MSHKLKTIQTQLFTIVLMATMAFAQTQKGSKDVRSESQLNYYVAPELTDNDLKLALSDLSLNDLKSLQALIDSADYNEFDYQDNSFTDKNVDTQNFDQQELVISNDKRDEEDYSFESGDIESNLADYLKRQKAFQTFIQENQRTKRDDQMLNSNDEEYLKQLVYSFPQNGMEGKESHVRVKRN